MNRELWEKCVAFHGHECPGLAIGFRAAEIAAQALGTELTPASDEEIVCVTENDACGVDAVQVMTGCTMGKGNLLYRPIGKMAFSFFLRKSGKKVRVILKPNKNPELTRAQWQEKILTAPAQEVFDVKQPSFELPERARIFANEVCECCGETAPEHKIRLQDGKKVCLDCFQDYGRGW